MDRDRFPVVNLTSTKRGCKVGSTYLGGKIDPSGPVPPKPDGVSGRRAVGLNRKPATDACMGSRLKLDETFDLYLTGPELFKAGDSGHCWDIVCHRALTRLRLKPGWAKSSQFWVILLSCCIYAIQALQD